MKTFRADHHTQARPARAGRERDLGFSLLEVLVSIAILSLATTIVATNVGRMVERERLEADQFLVSKVLATARTEAYASRRTVPIESQRAAMLAGGETELEKLQFSDALVVEATGFCSRGTGMLRRKSETYEFEVQGASCKVVFGAPSSTPSN